MSLKSTEGQKTSKLAVRFFSNAAIYGLGSVVVRFGSFLLLPVYWQVLTPEDFGQIAIAQMITVLLASVLDMGISGSIQRHFFEWKSDERPRHLAAVWSFSFLVSLAVVTLLTLLIPFIRGLFTEEVVDKVLLLGIWTAFFQNFGVLPFSLCRIQERLSLFSVLSIGQFVVQTLSILIFLIPLKMGYEGFLWGVFVGSAVYGGACLIFILKEIRFPWAWEHLRGPLRYALPTVPVAFLEGMGTVADRFFLQRIIPLTELGLYSLSRQFGQAFNFFQGTLKNSWIPLVYRMHAEREDAAKIIAKMGGYYLVVLAIPALAIAALSKDLIFLIGKPEYFPVAQYIPAIVAATMLWGVGNIYGRGIDLAKKTDVYWIIYLANFLTNITLLYYLTPSYGVWGAIAAFFLAGMAREILQIGLSFYYYPKPFDARPVLWVVGLFLPGFWLTQQLEMTSLWLSLFLKSLVIAMVSLAALVGIIRVPGLKKIYQALKSRSKKISALDFLKDD